MKKFKQITASALMLITLASCGYLSLLVCAGKVWLCGKIEGCGKAKRWYNKNTNACVVTGIGSNGYIVGANPKKGDK